MPTVGELSTKVRQTMEQFVVLQDQVSKGYAKTVGSSSSASVAGPDSAVFSELRRLEEEKSGYDIAFREKESELQALGGKTRRQTLQEFVLLFFFVAYAVSSLTLVFLTYTTEGTIAAAKMLGMLLLGALLIVAILIRYA